MSRYAEERVAFTLPLLFMAPAPAYLGFGDVGYLAGVFLATLAVLVWP